MIKDFIRLEGDVISITAHDKNLYCLTYYANSLSDVIHVFDTNGEPMTMSIWRHPKALPYWGSRTTVLNDSQFAVGDWASKQIIIYSLTGNIIKEVPCHSTLTSKSRITMTNCGKNSVVISEIKASTVTKINMDDGKVMWSMKIDSKPCGMVLCNAGHLLVAHYSSFKADLSIGERGAS